MNWDDLKFFLAVCREGSIRGAAKQLNVNHSTVSRRINSFEQSLEKQLFKREKTGYVQTKLAQEIYRDALHLESRLNAVERRIAGKDKTLKGEIKITLPDLLAQNLLMPCFAAFCQQYPDIDLQIIDSTRPFNLVNREADIAFRICDEPPEHLVGRKLANIHRACYMARANIGQLKQSDWLLKQSWIGWNDNARRPVGKIAKDYPRFNSKHKIMSAPIQAEACKQGMGIAILPCFQGDNIKELVRVPPYSSEHKYNLWLLSHPDLRNNKKIQTFFRFMVNEVEKLKTLIEGQAFSLSSLDN